jgi:uncharacterized Zn finger protein
LSNEELTILVKGSSADPYELIFIKDGASLTAICTCPAGSFGNLCKHRVAILDGDTSAVVGDDASKVPTVVGWLSGTDVESALAELRAVIAAKAPKEDLAAAKRVLAKAMNS